jgi:FkbM family methyltransferase
MPDTRFPGMKHSFMRKSAPLFISWLVSILPRMQPYARGPLLRRVYWALFNIWDHEGPPARTKLYGTEVLMNRGNLLPFFIQNVPLFNAPLVQLVHFVASAKGAPITLIDVGAAIGDTVLLIKERCPGVCGHFICIEGDAEFYELLDENMKTFSDVTRIKTLLARESMRVPSLVKHHKGTATCTGTDTTQAMPLDSIPAVNEAQIDVIKVDVDGFDGEVLAGAVKTLQRCRPAVIFEWDPKRILEAGNERFRAFDALQGCGYDRFYWFNNNGSFSHFSDTCSREVLDKEFQYLLAMHDRTKEHFDIVALHSSVTLNEVEFAMMPSVPR